MKGNVGDNGNISIFSDVHPNPLVEDVVQGSEMLRKHNCDSVIAIGGRLCNKNTVFHVSQPIIMPLGISFPYICNGFCDF